MGVGKSSLLSQYIKKEFPESPLPTIAIEFATKIIKIKEGGYVKAQIWDTAGQEKYKSITSHHYRKAVGALLVYDVTRKLTFENCIKWYNELKFNTEKECVICIVGNKCDLVEENPKRREVSTEEGREFARKNKTLFFEISAKNNNNVVECFEELLQQIYNTRRKMPNNQDLTESIVLKKKIIQKSDNNNESLCC
jgi:Rab family protein